MPQCLAYGGCTSSCHLELCSAMHQTLQTCWCDAAFVGDLFQSLLNFGSWGLTYMFCGDYWLELPLCKGTSWRKERLLVSRSPCLGGLPDCKFATFLPFGHFKPKTQVKVLFIINAVERMEFDKLLQCVLLKQHGHMEPAWWIHIKTKYF